jgi:hypothetical protein
MDTSKVFPRDGQTRPELARELLALARAGGHSRDAVRVDTSGGFVVPSPVAVAWIGGSAAGPAGPAAAPEGEQVDAGPGPDTGAGPTPIPDLPATQPAPPVVTEKSSAAEIAGGIGAERPRRPRKKAQPTKKVT